MPTQLVMQQLIARAFKHDAILEPSQPKPLLTTYTWNLKGQYKPGTQHKPSGACTACQDVQRSFSDNIFMGFIYGIAKALRDFLCLILEPGFHRVLQHHPAVEDKFVYSLQLCPARILPRTRSPSRSYWLFWPRRPALRRASSLTKSPCVPGPQPPAFEGCLPWSEPTKGL